MTTATYTTPAIIDKSAVTVEYRPSLYLLTTECSLGAETVVSEGTFAVYNKPVQVFVPSRKGYNLYLDGMLLDNGYIYIKQ